MSPLPPPTRDQIKSWIRQYGPMCYQVARSYLRNHEDAKDVVQQAWIILLERGHTIDRHEMVGPWLYKVVFNLSRTERRKRLERLSWDAEYAAKNQVLEVEAEDPNIMSGDIRRRIAEAVHRLPGLQQEAVLHRLVDGLSTKMTAHVMYRSEGTVKTSLRRALKKLREELGDVWDRIEEQAPLNLVEDAGE